MDKYDVKRDRRDLYAPSAREFTLVNVPPTLCLAVDGHGDPNTEPTYARAVEALYATAYAIKFASKRQLERDFVVGPLEGLWRADDPSLFVEVRKSEWDWTMLITLPDWIDDDAVASALAQLAAKKELPALSRVRGLILTEGLSAQILHLGPYDAEAPTIARLHAEFLPGHGLEPSGDHHEIYLSDPRRTAPEKLRTILRQPARAIRQK